MPEHSEYLPCAFPDYDLDPSPEILLLKAVLFRAIWDLLGDVRTEQQIKRASKEWFLSESKFPFSFFWICHELEVDPYRLRNALIALLEKGVIFNQNNFKRHGKQVPRTLPLTKIFHHYAKSA